MSALGKVANLLRLPGSQRPFFTSFGKSILSPTCSPRRGFFSMAESQNDLFEYTSGGWVYNEALRLKERRGVFDVDGLRRLAAESINRDPTDVIGFSKLAESGFNRVFLVTLRDGRKMVAPVPFPFIGRTHKFYTIASEVATIEYMRSVGIPAPEIYGYSTDSENAAGTAYVLMDFIEGTKHSEIWPVLDDQEAISVINQLTQLESRMMSLSFPAGGSLYFTADLERVNRDLGIPLDDKRFCVGPDTMPPLWYGRRAELDMNRGPYENAEATLAAAAHKEIAYLKQFGLPLLPKWRERRSAYNYQPQLPSYHLELLEKYLSITPSIITSNPAFSRFCIRHPDLHPNNIFVSKSLDTGYRITTVFDWQHTSILPMFLLAGIPQRLQNYEDPVSESMALPSLPENFSKLSEEERVHEDYDRAVNLLRYMKQKRLQKAASEEKRVILLTHWAWGDMDVDMYL